MLDDNIKSLSLLKKPTPQDNIKSFECRIRELSGNKHFQLGNLSPDIQVIIKRYLSTKSRDEWDELGVCLESAQQPINLDQYIPFKRSIFPNTSSGEQRADNLYNGLFETLQVKRIVQQRQYTAHFAQHYREQSTTMKQKEEKYLGRILHFQSSASKKNNNLPPIQEKHSSQKGFFKQLKVGEDAIVDSCNMSQMMRPSPPQDLLQNSVPCRKQPDETAHKRRQRYKKESFKEDTNNDETTTYEMFTKDRVYPPSKIIAVSSIVNSQKLIQQQTKLPQQRKQPTQNIDDLLPIFKDPKFQKDKAFQVKYVAYREAQNILNLGNNLFVQTPQPLAFSIYKCFVGKGNNGMMVRQVLKSRWWWCCVENTEEIEQTNFIWTQCKNVPFLDSLKQLRRIKIDETLSTCMNVLASGDESQNSEVSDNEGKAIISMRKKSIKANNICATQFHKTTTEQNTNPEWQRLKRVFSHADQDIMNSVFVGKRILSLDQATKYKRNLQVHQDPTQIKIHNHLEHHYHITNKKALFYNMRAYYQVLKLNVFAYLPLTFHLKGPKDTEEFARFHEAFQKQAELEITSDRKVRNIWILKPGENSNRGNGIRVCSTLQEVKDIVASGGTHKNGMPKTHIIQQYMDRPLLYQKRKFDIRCFIVISSINGHMRGYWYQEGYVRTSSKEFSMKNLQNRMIHLTNDAVQKKSDNYGRYEKGNKVSFDEFQKYLQSTYNADFMGDMYGQMKNLARDIIRAAFLKIDPNRRENTFEVFGLDFMIDENFKVWLIEVNTNPCLETSSPILNRIIPYMIDNVFRIILDPLFPPPHYYSQKKMVQEGVIETNKLELVFDECDDGPALQKLFEQQKDDPLNGEIIEESEEEQPDEDD